MEHLGLTYHDSEDYDFDDPVDLPELLDDAGDDAGFEHPAPQHLSLCRTSSIDSVKGDVADEKTEEGRARAEASAAAAAAAAAAEGYDAVMEPLAGPVKELDVGTDASKNQLRANVHTGGSHSALGRVRMLLWANKPGFDKDTGHLEATVLEAMMMLHVEGQLMEDILDMLEPGGLLTYHMDNQTVVDGLEKLKALPPNERKMPRYPSRMDELLHSIMELQDMLAAKGIRTDVKKVPAHCRPETLPKRVNVGADGEAASADRQCGTYVVLTDNSRVLTVHCDSITTSGPITYRRGDTRLSAPPAEAVHMLKCLLQTDPLDPLQSQDSFNSSSSEVADVDSRGGKRHCPYGAPAAAAAGGGYGGAGSWVPKAQYIGAAVGGGYAHASSQGVGGFGGRPEAYHNGGMVNGSYGCGFHTPHGTAYQVPQGGYGSTGGGYGSTGGGYGVPPGRRAAGGSYGAHPR